MVVGTRAGVRDRAFDVSEADLLEGVFDFGVGTDVYSELLRGSAVAPDLADGAAGDGLSTSSRTTTAVASKSSPVSAAGLMDMDSPMRWVAIKT